MKISINLLGKYYQENKEKLQKKARERYQNLLKKKRKKKTIMGSWTFQKSFKKWKKETSWVEEKIF